MRTKKWCAALLVLCMLLTAAACGKSGGGPEQQYAAAIRQNLSSGDTETAKKILKEALDNFPDSQVLLDIQEEMNDSASAADVSEAAGSKPVTEKETAPKEIAPPTAEQVQKIFAKFSTLYATWFTSMNLAYDGSSAKSVRTGATNATSTEGYAYRVQSPTVRTKADLDALFLPYCTQEVYQKLSDPIESWGYDLQSCRYLDIDGELYVVVPDLVYSATDNDIHVEPQGDGSFLVQFIRMIFVKEYSARGGNTEYLRCTMRFGSTQEGYRFDSFSATSMMIGQRIDTGTYIVNTSGSDLMLHNVPSDSKESRTGAVSNGKIVTVQESIVDWAFIESEDNDYGWVSAKYLVPYTGGSGATSSAQRSSNNSNGNYNNSNPIGEIIGGGLQIADGVIRAIL